MKVSILLLIAAIAEVGFGLGLIATPELMMNIFGVTSNAGSLFLARMFGAAILSLAILFWMSRNLTSTESLKPVLTAGLVYNLLAFVLILLATLSGAISATAWGAVVLHVLLTAGFGYFSFAKSGAG